MIVRNNNELLPDGNTEIREGDKLVVVGFSESLEIVEKMFGSVEERILV